MEMNEVKTTPEQIKKFSIVFLIVIVVVSAFVYFMENREEASLIKNKGFTTGVILSIDWSRDAKSTDIYPCYIYNLSVKGKTTLARRIIGDEYDIDRQFKQGDGIMIDSFIGKTFPIMYDTTSRIHPPFAFTNVLLIFPDNFKQYNLPFPDSLKWVLKFNRKYSKH
jgi:hypothetical protein